MKTATDTKSVLEAKLTKGIIEDFYAANYQRPKAFGIRYGLFDFEARVFKSEHLYGKLIQKTIDLIRGL